MQQHKNTYNSHNHREQGKNELCGFRAKAGVLAATVPLSSPSPVKPAGESHLVCVKPSPTWP